MTTSSPHAPLRPLHAAEVRWSSGFWGSVQDRTFTSTVPTIWDSLSDGRVSPGLRNFRIAAGLEDGAHDGPPFMDGDFYKWLEAAIAQLEVAPTEELAARIVDAVFQKRLPHALRQPAMHLALDDHRVDDAPEIVGRGERDELDRPRVPVDLHLGDVRP